MSRPIVLLVIAFMIWKLVDMGWHGWIGLIGLRTVLGVHRRRPTDVSHRNTAPPPALGPRIHFLTAMGFHRLGEAQLKLPFRPLRTTWVFVDSENKVQAEMALGRVSFSTFFQSEALVVTDYPNGEHIETPTYLAHTITTSLRDAYQHHLTQVIRFSQKYGIPHSIHSMNDYLHWETMGRVQPYGRLKLRRFLWIEIVRIVAFAYGSLIILLSLSYWVKPSLVPPNWRLTQEQVELLTIVLALPALVIPDAYRRWMMKQTHKDSAAR